MVHQGRTLSWTEPAAVLSLLAVAAAVQSRPRALRGRQGKAAGVDEVVSLLYGPSLAARSTLSNSSKDWRSGSWWRRSTHPSAAAAGAALPSSAAMLQMSEMDSSAVFVPPSAVPKQPRVCWGHRQLSEDSPGERLQRAPPSATGAARMALRDWPQALLKRPLLLACDALVPTNCARPAGLAPAARPKVRS